VCPGQGPRSLHSSRGPRRHSDAQYHYSQRHLYVCGLGRWTCCHGQDQGDPRGNHAQHGLAIGGRPAPAGDRAPARGGADCRFPPAERWSQLKLLLESDLQFIRINGIVVEASVSLAVHVIVLVLA